MLSIADLRRAASPVSRYGLTVASVCAFLAGMPPAGAFSAPPSARGLEQPAAQTPDLLVGGAWDCVTGATQADGKVTVVAGGSFNTVVNDALVFKVEGPFRVAASIEAATPDFAGITLYGVPPAPRGDWWRDIKRLDVGLRSGGVAVTAYDGTSQTPAFNRNFAVTVLGPPADLEVRAGGGQIVFAASGTDIGQIENPGLFASGRLYLGANVAPNNRLTIDALTVEANRDSGSAALAPDAPTLAVPPDQSGQATLKSLAGSRGLLVGASVSPVPLQRDSRYRELVARQFSIVTTENALKFGPVHPAPDRYTFCNGDAIMDFAMANELQVRGHTLVWHTSQPAWITDRAYTRDELSAILRDHIFTVVGRYRGRISYWDVVNEAVADDGSLRDTLWLRGIGPDYIDMAFRWAHEADPDAVLFYNEYSAEGIGRKSDAVYRLVTDLRARGVPIGGVGLQSHFRPDAAPSASDLAANMARLAALGLQMHITELDVRLRLPAGEDALAAQAGVYRRALEACMGQRSCTAFVGWNVYDGDSWIPRNYPGFGAAHLFDADFRPKPAYDALIAALRGT